MKPKNTPVILIFITLLIDMIGIGIIIPIMPSLLEELTGKTWSESAWIGGLLIAVYAAMQFFFAPVLGEISDRFGRRKVILISLFMLSIDYLFHALAPTVFWLFVGRFLGGITGATHSVGSAYIADISTKENKAKNFGIIGAAFGLGFILGTFMGGILSEFGIRTPFYVAAVFTLINFILAFFFLPESLKPENRRAIDYSKMIPGVSIISIRRYNGLLIFFIALFFMLLAGNSLPTVWSFFTKELFNWSDKEISYNLSFIGLLVAIVQGVLVGKFVKKIGESNTIKLGYILYTIGFLLFAFVAKSYQLYLFSIVYILGGIAQPTLQGLMSNKVIDSEQGNLQGAIASMVSLTMILTPLIANSSFSFFTGPNAPIYFPGISYLISAVFAFCGTVLVWKALKVR